MKRIIFAVAAIVAASSFGASYEDWFTPKTGWSKQTVPVHIRVSSFDYAENFPVDTKLGDIVSELDGWIAEQGISESAKNAFKMSVAALANSIFAACQAQMNKVKIDNLGAALEGVFVQTYGQYEDESGNVISKSKSGVDTAKLRQQLIANKNAVVSGGQASGGSEANPLTLVITQKPYEEHQFDQLKQGGKSLVILRGSDDLQKGSTTLGGASEWFWEADGYFFPMTLGSPTSEYLEWAKFGGIGEEFECSTASDERGKLRLKDFRGWTGDDLSLDWLLSDKTSEGSIERTKYQVLARRRDGTKSVLTYLPIEDYIQGGGDGIPADEASIETHIDGDTTNLCVYGFNDAVESAAAGDEYGYIPYTDGSETLQWAGMSEFFADSVFKKSEKTGKILLNGTSEEGKTTVLAISGDGEEEQTLTTFSGDGVSIDFGIDQQGQPQAPLAQLHNFDNPARQGAQTDNDFADILTNANVETTGWHVPLRTSGGVLQYAPLAKVTGIPSASVDDLTIEATKDEGAGDNDPDKLRIKGAKEATNGQVLMMGQNGEVKWEDAVIEVDRPEGLEEDEYALYITEADPDEDEPAKIGINGWDTVDSPEGLYGAGNGKPIMYRFADIQSLEADSEKQTVELKGYDDAGRYSMPFKGESDDGLGWVAPPSSGSALLTMNAGSDPTATVIGNSVETETVSGKATLNIKNFTNGGGCDTTMSDMLTSDSQSLNRSRHQVLTRYTGGSNPAVHWVDMGDKIGGGGSPVDDSSITTNTAHGAVTSGIASIYGFNDASEGDVPHKTDDGKIEWKQVASAGTTGSFALNVTTNASGYVFNVGAGYYSKARTYYYVNSASFSTSGWIVLKTSMTSKSAELILQSVGSFTPDTYYTYTPLYSVNATTGKFADYRGAPHIQAWE